ncbi:YlbF family regulator [Pediococcus acidilactici]
MTVNIYDTANQMEQELRLTNEYQNLKQSFEKVQQDENASALYKKFQDIQSSLQQKQMNGEELTEDEIKKVHEVAGKIEKVDLIKDLMDKERSLNQLINDVNQIIMKPIQELYQG